MKLSMTTHRGHDLCQELVPKPPSAPDGQVSLFDVPDTVNAKRFPPVPFRLGNGYELERGGI